MAPWFFSELVVRGPVHGPAWEQVMVLCFQNPRHAPKGLGLNWPGVGHTLLTPLHPNEFSVGEHPLYVFICFLNFTTDFERGAVLRYVQSPLVPGKHNQCQESLGVVLSRCHILY